MNDTITNLVPLTEGYYYTADDNQYILYECGTRKKIDRKTRKATDEDMNYQDVIGYYSSLTSLLKGLVRYATRHNVSEGKLTTFKDTIEYLERISDKLEDMTRGV